MTKRAKRIYGLSGAKQTIPISVFTWGMFALFFGGFGAYRSYVTGTPEWFMLLFGAMSLVFAVVSYRRLKSLQLNC